jgi:hypothetical protein
LYVVTRFAESVTLTRLSPMYIVRGIPAGHSNVAVGHVFPAAAQTAVVQGQATFHAFTPRIVLGFSNGHVPSTQSTFQATGDVVSQRGVFLASRARASSMCFA